MLNKVVFLIIVKILVILNFSLTKTYAANENDFKHREHAQRLINEFFLDDKLGSCANDARLSIECKSILTDALIISHIGNSFDLLPSKKVYSRTLRSTEYKYPPFETSYLHFDKMTDFRRSKLRSALLKLPEIFECIEAGCGRYSILPKKIRHMSIRGYKDAIAYLECFLKIDKISFGRQAHVSYNYYHKNPIGYKVLVDRINLNRFFQKRHDFLFMEHNQFKECTVLNTSRDALNLIIRSGSKFAGLF